MILILEKIFLSVNIPPLVKGIFILKKNVLKCNKICVSILCHFFLYIFFVFDQILYCQHPQEIYREPSTEKQKNIVKCHRNVLLKYTIKKLENILNIY